MDYSKKLEELKAQKEQLIYQMGMLDGQIALLKQMLEQSEGVANESTVESVSG